MKDNNEHMIRIHEDLFEHGIVAYHSSLDLIISMQELDYNQVTKGVDPDQEYMRLLNKIKSM